MVSLRSILRWAVVTLRQAAWAPMVVVAAHAVAIVGWNAYRWVPSLDVAMHFAGGVAIAFFLHRASLNASRFGLIGPFHRVTHVVLVGSLTCVAAVVWEFAEFLLDRTLGTHSQPGLADTMIDLLLGNLGGAAFLVSAFLVGFLRNGPMAPSDEPPLAK